MYKVVLKQGNCTVTDAGYETVELAKLAVTTMLGLEADERTPIKITVERDEP